MRKILLFLAAIAFLVGCAGRTHVAPAPAASQPAPLPAAAPIEAPERGVGFVPVAPPDPNRFAYADPETTVKGLCEPVDARRPYPTRKERKATIALIERTCVAMEVGENDCLYFTRIVALRESSYRPWVRHKMPGDVAAAATAYLRSSLSYGWRVEWSKEAKQREDLAAIELTAVGGRYEPNLYFTEVERWLSGGLGLGGVNIPYHLSKFDRMAPPEILCDAVVNVMVQITTARNAVYRYHARNWYEIQAVYGGRTYWNLNGVLRPLSCSRGCPKNISDEQRAKALAGDKSMRKRCEAKEFDCLATPELGMVLYGPEFTAEDRYELAEEIRGTPLPPFDFPRQTVTVLEE